MKKKKGVCIFVIGMVCMLFPFGKTEAAVSDTTTAQVIMQGGGLGIITPNAGINFGTVTIDGNVKTVSAPLGTMNVMDLTGTGNGWNVTVSATQFSNGTFAIPLNSLKLVGIQSVAPDGTTSPSPSIIGTGNYTLDNGSANKILSANANTGMGRYNVDFVPNALKLAVDTSVVKTSGVPYSSTITWTMVTGP